MVVMVYALQSSLVFANYAHIFMDSTIGVVLLFLIFSVAYNRYALNQRGFSQLPHMPFSSSSAFDAFLDTFYDMCDRIGFTRNRWASDHSWRGFSSGSEFERPPTSHEEAQSMLNSGHGRHSDEENEDAGDDNVAPRPTGMDDHGVIRL